MSEDITLLRRRAGGQAWSEVIAETELAEEVVNGNRYLLGGQDSVLELPAGHPPHIHHLSEAPGRPLWLRLDFVKKPAYALYLSAIPPAWSGGLAGFLNERNLGWLIDDIKDYLSNLDEASLQSTLDEYEESIPTD